MLPCFGMDNRAALVCGDWAAPMAGRFELILCNPPYVPSSDLPSLMPEVARFEPASALDGGPDGLSAYRRILPDLPRLLAPDGVAILELGLGQAAAVSALADGFGLVARTRADLAGIPRARAAVTLGWGLKKPFGNSDPCDYLPSPARNAAARRGPGPWSNRSPSAVVDADGPAGAHAGTNVEGSQPGRGDTPLGRSWG